MFRNSPFREAIIEELGSRVKELNLMRKCITRYGHFSASDLRRYVDNAVMSLGDVENSDFCRAELMALDALAEEVVQYVRMTTPAVVQSTVHVTFSLTISHPLGENVEEIFNEMDYNFQLDALTCKVVDSKMLEVTVR